MMNVLIALIALIMQGLFSYPKMAQILYKHPVEWIGGFIAFADKHFNNGSSNRQKITGLIMNITLVFLSFLIAFIISKFLQSYSFGWVVEGIIAFVFISQKQLGEAVKAVIGGLEISLDEGRKAVAHIVGRDVKSLSESEVSRAAIETLAENASDGFIAPLFYLLLFGLPGIVIYKAINTADSMVGHRNEKYQNFGWASAKLDDFVNIIPSRICAFLFMIASVFMPMASAKKSLQTVLRDANKHASPNAGYPEAAMAGSLGFGLGGKRQYNGEILELPQMGEGKRDLDSRDINIALRLYNKMSALVLLAILMAGVFILLLQY